MVVIEQVNGAPDTPIIVGCIAGLFGVHGEVRICDYSRHRGDILDYDSWLLRHQEEWHEVTVRSGRCHRDTVVAKLEGWEDRESARELIGVEIAIQPDQLAETVEGEFYWHQLEGLTVMNLLGEKLGTVERLIETGANDVLVVQGERERLIPYSTQTISKVDLSAGLIEVTWELDY